MQPYTTPPGLKVSIDAFNATFDSDGYAPQFTGSIPLDENRSKLFYLSRHDEPRMIDFSSCPTDAELASLTEACDVATFGMNKEDVLDESYRKAWKMDTNRFSCQISIKEAIQGVRHMLAYTDFNSTGALDAELYKLNVYGPGSFFKIHVDTPRSQDMFGSLVVILPTHHEGGSLIFRHKGGEWTFDSASTVSEKVAAFVSFYSDVEHEVTCVTSGYRVTLTFNLSSTVADLTHTSAYGSSINVVEAEMKKQLAALLDNKELLPWGGLVGFGLSHKYPFQPEKTDLKVLEKSLKGLDSVLLRVGRSLGLDLLLKAYYRDEEDPDADSDSYLVDCFPDFEPLRDVYDHKSLVNFFHGDYEKQTIFLDNRKSMDRTVYEVWDPMSDASFFMWLKPLWEANNFKTLYVAYGNEPSVDYLYSNVCLVASVEKKESSGSIG